MTTTNPEDFFTADDLVDRPPDVHSSPSGRHRLEVRPYATKPDCWDYSRGTVIRVADGREPQRLELSRDEDGAVAAAAKVERYLAKQSG